MPRLGMGMPIAGGATEAAVLAVEDFVFLNDVSGELTPVDTSSRTNLITYSEDFSQWTRTGNTAISATNITSPTGTTNATTITGLNGGGGNDLRFFPSSFSSANKNLTFSVHLKGSGTLRIQMSNGIDQGIQEVITLTSDWKRHQLFGGFNSTNTSSGEFHCNIDDSSSVTATTYDVWGAQLEEDSRVSNYIPTSGSAVSVATTELGDLSNVWDFDGTDIMLEVDPENEGAFEEATQNLVLNHDYEELGSELVSSGTFSVFSVDSGDVTISGDTASYVDGGGNPNSRVSLASVLTANKMYKVIFDVTRYASGRVQFIFGGGGAVSVDISAGVGTYTAHVLAGSSTEVSVKRDGGFSGFDFDLTNISIKQVDPNNRWSLGTGWSISDGKAVAVATNSAGFSITQNNILTSNTQYEITYTLSDITAGSVRFRANLVSGTQRGSNGTYTEIITTAGDDFAFQGLDSFVGKIDNVTVKEYAITPLNV